MEKVNVWYAETWRSGLQVRMNSGEAIDLSNGYGAPMGVLHYEGDLNEILRRIKAVYRYNAGHLCRHFYLSEEDAWTAAKKAGLADKEGSVQKGHIQPSKYKAVQFPVSATIQKSERGAFCRLNLHPEIYGTGNHGKMYFIDRSCKDKMCAGPAIITSVIERTSFGFLIGHMQQFEAPTDEMISAYMQKYNLQAKSVQICSNKFGTFALLEDTCLICTDDHAAACEYPLATYDPELTVLQTVALPL